MKRKILVLNLSREAPVVRDTIEFAGMEFETIEHSIGWDFETGRELIRVHDGKVDAIALGGVQKNAVAGKTVSIHPGYRKLMRAAVQSPITVADGLREFFADWTLQRLIKEQPLFFAGRKTLFHCAVVSPFVKKLHDAGIDFRAADALLLTGVPRLIRTPGELETFLKIVKRLTPESRVGSMKSKVQGLSARNRETLRDWILDADTFVTFGGLLDRLDDLSALAGKAVITDYVSDTVRARLEEVGILQLIELIPNALRQGQLSRKPLALVAALLNQARIIERSEESFNGYVLKWVQEQNLQPNRVSVSRGAPRRCAFIVHALSQRDLLKVPGLKLMKNAPKGVRNAIESVAARAPIFFASSITGIRSELTGQEVICDLYIMAATPRQILGMDEDFVYRRLIEACELAKKRGAALIGLGAYTKVVGDAGVTVSRGSPIPVTNGNSYSASTTLWAARVMLERMGMVSPVKNGKLLRCKATIIGATGSIGRVSALLVSLVCDELVLVATQADKLLELKREISELSPEVKVKVTTNANEELMDSDLVVTATSSLTETVLDIDKVKPGAVVCDCSRPLDIGPEEAARRPDVMVIESGEVELPGNVEYKLDLGLPKPSVYACLAETVLLALEGKYENFSLSKQLSMKKVKEIYQLGLKHGATLSEIRGPNGVVTDEQVRICRDVALHRLKTWPTRRSEAKHPAVPVKLKTLEVSVSSLGETGTPDVDHA